jgi:SAM-dependent methyltransferase
VLGHTEKELDRLQRQARLIEPATREFLLAAGISEGMRVLDVGSGAGDVAILAAEIVGPAGEVIGTDTSSVAVRAATANAATRGMDHFVEFREGDPTELGFDRPFDAVIGRYVLIFQTDPASMLAKLAQHLVAGGIIAFHEPDWTLARSSPSAPLYDRCCGWIRDVGKGIGLPWNMADRFHRSFVDAGLPPPMMRMRTLIAAGIAAEPWLRAVVDLLESLLPTIEAQGIDTASEVDMATLFDRLVAEIGDGEITVLGRSEVGAWCRVGPSQNA